MFYIGMRILKTQGCRAAYNIYMHESAGGTDYVNSKGYRVNIFLKLQVWYWEKVSISHMYPTLQQPAGYEPPLMQYWDETRARERCKLGRNHPFGEGEVKEYRTLLCILLLYTYNNLY
jgi:hypothetical protein